MTLLFWSAVAILYLFVNVIPGRTGWGQAAFAASAFVLGWITADWITLSNPLWHWHWLIVTPIVFFAAGFDLAGIATARESDPEQFLSRLRFRKIGRVFRKMDRGTINFDWDKCSGCGACRDICPIDIFGELDEEQKTTFRDRGACFACGACVKQCPESALAIRPG
jgi:NAD-dependent dihydropyrimidine dehydrogenase PreA subunit